MSNDRDQEIVTSAISDTGSGLLEFLSALGQREAIAFGDGVALPVRIKFDELPKNCLPRSSTARFSEKWQHSVEDEHFLDAVVERWRSAGMGSLADHGQQSAMGAEAVNIPMAQHVAADDTTSYAPRTSLAPAAEPAKSPGYLRREPAEAGAGSAAAFSLRRELPQAPLPSAQPGAARQSLRDRLMKPQASR
jgi:uncharacterized protein